MDTLLRLLHRAPARSRRRYFRIRLTPQGWVIGIALWLTFSAALNTGINLLYLLAAALFSFLLVSLGVALNCLRGLKVRVSAPRAVNREQESAVSITIENRKWLLPAAGLRIESANAPGESIGYVQMLGAREIASVRVREVFRKRGYYSVPRYTLVSSFPFGLIETWRGFNTDSYLFVYPRVNALRTSAAEQASGSRYRARTASGDGDEFFSIRDYQPGDDTRKISWRTSARLGKLMVRELARQNSRYVLFLLDTRQDPAQDPAAFEQTFEDAVELVASLGVTLLERQYNVAIAAPQAVLENGEGTTQKRRLLDFLAGITPASMAEYPVFDEHHCQLDTQLPALLMVSADPAQWGRRSPGGGVRVLDPRDVIHA